VERLLAENWRVATFSRNANDFVEQTLTDRPEDFLWAPADLGDPRRVREFARTRRNGSAGSTCWSTTRRPSSRTCS